MQPVVLNALSRSALVRVAYGNEIIEARLAIHFISLPRGRRLQRCCWRQNARSDITRTKVVAEGVGRPPEESDHQLPCKRNAELLLCENSAPNQGPGASASLSVLALILRVEAVNQLLGFLCRAHRIFLD